MTAPTFKWDDGGRAAAGFKGEAPGDCVVRSIAIATQKPYREVYDAINALAGKPVARSGVPKRVYKPYLEDVIGAYWQPCMGIGTGCTVNLTAHDLPKQGRYVLRLSRHFAAWIDGAVYDIADPSRDGTRCVYGYWEMPSNWKY